MLQPGEQVGPYEVVRLVGRGGMSKVYQVTDTRTGKPWALKVLTLDEPGLAERFVDEAQMQSRLNNRHLVRAREMIRVGTRLGIVMEYVDGPGLDTWLERHPDASEAERLYIALRILKGVRAAHRWGLVHRDLKPGNVLLATDSKGRPVPRVTDFGLAKLRGVTGHTKTGMAMGTPRYMAPEQLLDAKHVDARADVYALGALLYELFSGVPAFGHSTFAEAYEALKEAGYRDPAELGVSEPVSAAIRKALEPDVSKRAQSCRDLADLLRGRVATSVRRRRWRHAGLLVATTVVAAAGAVVWLTDPNVLVGQMVEGVPSEILKWWSTIRSAIR